MKSMLKRLALLERKSLPSACCVVHTKPGESFQEAAARLKLPPGGYLVCGEPVSIELWLPIAQAQQAALVASGGMA